MGLPKPNLGFGSYRWIVVQKERGLLLHFLFSLLNGSNSLPCKINSNTHTRPPPAPPPPPSYHHGRSQRKKSSRKGFILSSMIIPVKVFRSSESFRIPLVHNHISFRSTIFHCDLTRNIWSLLYLSLLSYVSTSLSRYPEPNWSSN